MIHPLVQAEGLRIEKRLSENHSTRSGPAYRQAELLHAMLRIESAIHHLRDEVQRSKQSGGVFTYPSGAQGGGK